MNRRSPALVFFALMLSACGGGGGGDGGGSGTAPQSQKSTSFVAPVQGEKRVFTTTYYNVDGSSATTNFHETITQVNADASYTAFWTVDAYVFDGNHYGNDPWSNTYNAVGDVTKQAIVTGITYNFTYPAGGRPVGMQPGQTWDDSNVETCNVNNSTISTTVQGTYLGIEFITVPAGTFPTYKFQTKRTLPFSTYVVTDWYNASPTDSRLVRELTQYLFNSDANPPGEATSSQDMQLVSY